MATRDLSPWAGAACSPSTKGCERAGAFSNSQSSKKFGQTSAGWGIERKNIAGVEPPLVDAPVSHSERS